LAIVAKERSPSSCNYYIPVFNDTVASTTKPRVLSWRRACCEGLRSDKRNRPPPQMGRFLFCWYGQLLASAWIRSSHRTEN
jgi:hypothetical protein